MVRLEFTLIGNNAEAEEVVQDSFVEISRRFDEVEQPGAYLRTVVVSRCRSHLRRRRLMHHHAPTRPPDLPRRPSRCGMCSNSYPNINASGQRV